MWRTLLIAGLLAAISTLAQAQTLAWQTCRGAVSAGGPQLSDCRPIAGVIDPQGRELWLRAAIKPPADPRPRALYVYGVASSQAWLNGRRLGANGQPGPTPLAETPGRYQADLPIPDTIWRPDGNELIVRLSSFHGGLRLARPMGAVAIAPYPLPSNAPWLAITFVAAGALAAAAFGFGVIHAMRRTGASLILAAIAGVAALQAIVESLRSLFAYPYPLHVWRLSALWVLAAAFSVLLVAYVASRFLPKLRRPMIGVSLAAVGATALVPSFDQKTGYALIVGVILAFGVTAAGLRRGLPGARPTLAWLAVFIALGVGLPELLIDLSYFVLAASLVLPLLAAEVVRLGRDDRSREAALTEAVRQPDRLIVASARGVELAPTADIVAITGADDYVELRMARGRTLLHAARLDQLEAQLPAGFLRVHRSAIANLAQARRLERETGRWRLHLTEGEPLPVSRSRLPALREALDDLGVA